MTDFATILPTACGGAPTVPPLLFVNLRAHASLPLARVRSALSIEYQRQRRVLDGEWARTRRS
jgi:hypothetical protein